MKNIKIVIVEDEAIVAKDLRNRLEKFGYIVSGVASSGQEAINKSLEFCPDLVLMDIRLKGVMDGIEAAHEIHKHLDIPIIYLTAYADDKTLDRAKVTEPFGYLLKPFKERELQINIEIALTKHSLEKQLRTHQKWLSTLLNSISDGVISSDFEELVTFMNPVAESLTGWKQEEACGRNSSEVFNIAHGETHEPVENPIIKVLEEGNVVGLPAETVLISRNGTKIPIDDSAAPIKDDQDRITGAVLIFRDVTERKQAMEARQKQVEQEQLLAQLAEINQLKNEFLNLLSHELRSPLSNMKVMIQMLQMSITPEENQRYLEMLSIECDREMVLINDLLDLQRLESEARPVITPDVLLLEQWIPWIIEPFKVRIQQHQQTLQLNLPSNIPSLFSDGTSLERILSELLNNACKYTPSGGEIILSVDHNSSEIPSQTIITIRNSLEIPTAEIPRLFDKFYRLPHADIWNQGGTGLGLSIVQKLVERLQGIIQVESSEGWTTFRLILTDLIVTTS
ncbi:hybrid sensor histidine kinase/response regulator [Nodularia sphaerocarpa]|uniref:hybrid sensor histidine kinase/response regulator n=1 Tax=Nodularia sphaerocarpa TaxID=137816 RepID=UPI001EFAA0ED|nr:response regulator [Nodularia sphaerocarpa]MDB9375945.1 response regulator [Nodularia sphaerocarpa CS-585]MDB9378937.1 response regulator [Nodularia sphaerocarpa CS-585A2]ULP74685.1 Sensor histidine kinase WalK [Nodularia sphaerocarpa UHCC 0038]